MHIAIAEASSWRDVKVPDNFINSQTSLNTTSFVPLGIQLLAVVFPLALLDPLPTTECPR